MTSRDGKYLTGSKMCSLKRERRFPGELAFLSSVDVEGSKALENSNCGLFRGSRQLAIAGSCSDTHLGQNRLPELHTWPGRKDLGPAVPLAQRGRDMPWSCT